MRASVSKDLMTVRAVAKRLGFAEGFVYTLTARGQIPCVRISRALRFRPEDVDRFIRDHRRKTA